MARIFTIGNFIIATDPISSIERPYPRKGCRYDESADGFELIFDFNTAPGSISILLADVGSWTDADAVPYTATTLREFLQINTSVGETDTTGKEDKINKVSDFTTVNEVLYPNTRAVQSYLVQSLAGLTAYFFYELANAVESTYWQMKREASTGALQTITTAAVADDQILAVFMTNTGQPNITFIPSGIIKVTITADKSVGTKDAQLYAEIYKFDLSAVETLLCTTSSSIALPLTDPPASYSFDGTLPTAEILLSTDLILVKIIAEVTGAGTAPTITLGVEDNTSARIELPTTTLTFTPENIANKQDSLEDDGTGVKYPTVDAVNEGVVGSDLYLYSNFT